MKLENILMNTQQDLTDSLDIIQAAFHTYLEHSADMIVTNVLCFQFLSTLGAVYNVLNILRLYFVIVGEVQAEINLGILCGT